MEQKVFTKYNWRMIIVCIIPLIITICLDSSLTATLDNFDKHFVKGKKKNMGRGQSKRISMKNIKETKLSLFSSSHK